jgi:chaperonin cofactor prefoldin
MQVLPRLAQTLRRHGVLPVPVWVALVLMMLPPVGIAADKNKTQGVRDLFFGEALFHAAQKNHFDAVTLLDAELAQYYSLDDPTSDSLSYHREESELFVADHELSYRMHRKVGRAMQRLLDKSVHESIRDRAAYRLARVAFIKSSYETALENLDQISANAPRKLQLQAALLRGQCLISLGRHKEAVAVLQPVAADSTLAGFGPYNYGIALLESGDTLAGYQQLNKVGTQTSQNEIMSGLRDKANLTMGFTLLRNKESVQARKYLERIQLEGPFSNKALLWVGWSDASQGNYDQALVPWMILRKRDITDVAVQEAMLAAPYGFGQLKAFGRSAVLYGEAVEVFDREVGRVDASIQSIREGKFLDAMLSDKARTDSEWLFSLRKLPDAPETRYMRDLMAGHVFNESYKNYRDLDDLEQNVAHWQSQIPAYLDLLRVRRNYYAPLLPRINSSHDRLDKHLTRITERRDQVATKLKKLLRKRDPMAMATAREKTLLRQLESIRKRIDRLRPQPGRAMLKQKYERLHGLLYWQVNTEYETRLSQAHQHLRDLDKAIAMARATQADLVRAKSEAALSYQGYDRALADLKARLDFLKVRIAGLKAHQGQYMERRAINELRRRKFRLQRYRTKARFAMAESYDRAIRNQKEKLKTKVEPK